VPCFFQTNYFRSVSFNTLFQKVENIPQSPVERNKCFGESKISVHEKIIYSVDLMKIPKFFFFLSRIIGLRPSGTFQFRNKKFWEELISYFP
jgi:hypothetical protein